MVGDDLNRAADSRRRLLPEALHGDRSFPLRLLRLRLRPCEAYGKARSSSARRHGQGQIRLVYGGGGIGLMGTLAKSVVDHGGKVLGIIPDFLKRKEMPLDAVIDVVTVPDMHTRKMRMFTEADAFVALPGGIGTLEELVEQLTWAQLGRHAKPVVVANIGGFWDPLRVLLDHMKDEGSSPAGPAGESIRSSTRSRHHPGDPEAGCRPAAGGAWRRARPGGDEKM